MSSGGTFNSRGEEEEEGDNNSGDDRNNKGEALDNVMASPLFRSEGPASFPSSAKRLRHFSPSLLKTTIPLVRTNVR